MAEPTQLTPEIEAELKALSTELAVVANKIQELKQRTKAATTPEEKASLKEEMDKANAQRDVMRKRKAELQPPEPKKEKEVQVRKERIGKNASPAPVQASPAPEVVKEAPAAALDDDKQDVNPWSVSGSDEKGIDYNALVKDFGSSLITPEMLERFEKLTGRKPHRYLRRGLFFSHREFDKIMDWYEQKKPFYLYTGRGPSSDSLHLGHVVPFIFTQWLQEVFGCIVVIQMTDDEKFLWKDLTIEDVKKYTLENTKDIIACGFDPTKTFIFSDLAYVGHMYELIVKLQKKISAHKASCAFGFTDQHNVGQWGFVAIQAAPSFPEAFPSIFGKVPNAKKNVRCLIPCGIDQDPYFRLTRDVSGPLGFHKPALIHSKFFPSLQGPKGKMSASVETSAIFLTDDAKKIKSKINKAFSGGQPTLEEHRRLGGNPDIDVCYQYLTFFLEDDAELQQTYDDFKSGKMLVGEIKGKLTQILTEFVMNHQALRAKVSRDLLDTFMTPRELDLRSMMASK